MEKAGFIEFKDFLQNKTNAIFDKLGLRRRYSFFFIVFLVGLILWMIFYFPYYTKLNKLRQENDDLRIKINKIKEEIADYQQKGHLLKKDPYLLEKVAREDLGVARDGEIVVDIKD